MVFVVVKRDQQCLFIARLVLLDFFHQLDRFESWSWANDTLYKVSFPQSLFLRITSDLLFSLRTISKGPFDVRSIGCWFGHSSSEHRDLAECRCHGVTSSVVARCCAECSTNSSLGFGTPRQLFRSSRWSRRSRRHSPTIGLFTRGTERSSPLPLEEKNFFFFFFSSSDFTRKPLPSCSVPWPNILLNWLNPSSTVEHWTHSSSVSKNSIPRSKKQQHGHSDTSLDTMLVSLSALSLLFSSSLSLC